MTKVWTFVIEDLNDRMTIQHNICNLTQLGLVQGHWALGVCSMPPFTKTEWLYNVYICLTYNPSLGSHSKYEHLI